MAFPGWTQENGAIALRDKRAIQSLLWALRPFSEVRTSMPLPYAVAFLAVALEEGKSVGAYARELNVDRYTMSRYMRCIAEHGRDGRGGLGLVSIRRTNGKPMRTKVNLTEKGRTVAAQIFRGLRLPAAA